MVLIKIGIVAAAIAGLMVMAQSGRWFERVGLMSHCEVTTAPYGAKQQGQWWTCHEGAISGFPSLVRDHCESRGIVGRTQLWHCPAPIEHPS